MKRKVRNFIFNHEFIKSKLKEEGRSQVWVAEQTGINKTVLTRILNGQTKATLNNANKIAKLLNIKCSLVSKEVTEKD
jgi:ribosome-binding protein aMBF1 (putative translation factor)